MTVQKIVQDQKTSYPYPALPGPGSMGVISARNIRAPLLLLVALQNYHYFLE
jgi:hypothetical protein